MSGTDAAAQQSVFHLTDALNAIRKAKTDQKVSVGTPVRQVIYFAAENVVTSLALVERDLKAACRADGLVLRTGEPHVEITLMPAEA